MEILKSEIEDLKSRLRNEDKQLVSDEYITECSKYPFSEYANTIIVLLKGGILSYEHFVELRDAYYRRNPNLDVFEQSPRTFGQTWGERYLRNKYPVLVPPSIDFDPNFNGEYDLWLPRENAHLNGIKIEVKASHVVKDSSGGTLVGKGYKWTENKNNTPFKMNFQQLKPQCCDVFVWMAVWLDRIDIWVIPSNKIIKRTKKHKNQRKIVNQLGYLHMSSQHRGGRNEGQIFVTNKHYHDLDRYRVSNDQILTKIREYGNIDQGT